jgi:hypothetical protein
MAHATGMEPGYRVTRKTHGQYELQLWGKMPIGWIGNLTGGMAGTGISIERGSVQKVDGAAWQAGFEMKPLTMDAVPERIDFIRLASQGSGAAGAATFSLDGFTIREPAGRNDPLYLEVRAAEQKGFLGALLSRLAFFSLFPEEMSIETSNDRIFDRLWLRSPGGQSPSAEVTAVLRKSLTSRLCC